ncbi:MAG TPA: plastocyanin/azurin family copper-binding protein [Actinomycetota bacterium]|nr:plastocyanin/azurin family copper-binding protein [Actinomycetota bacterium]
MRPSIRHLSAILVLAFTIVLAACGGQPDRGASEAPVVGAHDVTAKDLQFQPPAIQVRPGTTVTWHFEDGAIAHDVKGEGFSSPIKKSGTFSHRFDQPGTFEYRCTLHASMTGRVIVR